MILPLLSIALVVSLCAHIVLNARYQKQKSEILLELQKTKTKLEEELLKNETNDTTPKERTAIFYLINKAGERYGINPVKIQHLIQEGRRIRTSSTAAEYGLFEAVVLKRTDILSPIIVRDCDNNRTAEIYVERIAEIQLNEKEAKELGLGFPR